MSKEHLIPFNKMEKKRHLELSSRGGRSESPAKRFSARLRELKKKGLTDDSIKRITDIIEDPECSALDVKLFIESLRNKKLSNGEKLKLANLMISWHSSHHGKQNNVINFNLNAEIKHDLEKWFSYEEDK